jgi:metallo-beta-lactamase class B
MPSTADTAHHPRPAPFLRRRWPFILLGAVVIAIALVYPKWRRGTDNGGQLPAEPFRIAGNFYYVGASDVASFLITGPQGHILIDGGYPGTPSLITASIAKLGFDIRDVKVLLNSEPHFDHAGGLAALQKASGAQLWASEPSARALERGGYDDAIAKPMGLVTWLIRYPAPRVDHIVKDGDTIRVGPIAVTAHLTPGHTRGCTSWTFPVRDGDRVLNVVSACSLVTLGNARYPGQQDDFERTFRVLRSLPADIWVTSHARLFGRYRKFVASRSARNPVEAFIDPAGYRAYIDSGEARFRRGAEH